jgi:hypothetical protein
MENNIILVGKLVTEHADEIAEGYAQVEFDVEKLLDEIEYSDIRRFAKNKLDLIPIDELDDVDEDDMVEELRDRGYNFIIGADDETLINELKKSGYKCIYEYDQEYYDFLQIADLDVQDMHMLKEITKKFMNASVFEKADIYQAINNHEYLLSLETKLKNIKIQL